MLQNQGYSLPYLEKAFHLKLNMFIVRCKTFYTRTLRSQCLLSDCFKRLNARQEILKVKPH